MSSPAPFEAIAQLLERLALVFRRVALVIVVDKPPRNLDLHRACVVRQLDLALVEREHDLEPVLEHRALPAVRTPQPYRTREYREYPPHSRPRHGARRLDRLSGNRLVGASWTRR